MPDIAYGWSKRTTFCQSMVSGIVVVFIINTTAFLLLTRDFKMVMKTKTNYNIYFSAREFSGIGDALQDIAIIAIIATLTNATWVSGLIVMLNALIRIMCSIHVIKIKYFGNIAERLRKLNFGYAGITLLFYILLRLISRNQVIAISVMIYETICSLIYTFYKIYQDVVIKEVSTSNEEIARLYTADQIVKIASSFIASILLAFISYEGFLLVNAASFILSGWLISRLKLYIEHSNVTDQNVPKHTLICNIKGFCNQYPEVFRFIMLSALLSFFVASYSVLYQHVMKEYAIKSEWIGIINGMYYAISIIFSYLAGFIKMKHIKWALLLVFAFGASIAVLCALQIKYSVFALLLVLYPLIGSGYNTLSQIYFQRNTLQSDIPMLKGIYNITCGISIFLSGVLAPLLMVRASLFYIIVLLIFDISVVFVIRDKKIKSF